MPTYQYSCAACGARPEVQQRMTDDALTVCPACGADGLRKLFTGVGVVFKGSGFYRTDSRGAASSGDSGGASGGTSGSGGSGGSSGSGSSSGGSGGTGGSGSGGSSGSSGGSAPATSAPAATSA